MRTERRGELVFEGPLRALVDLVPEKRREVAEHRIEGRAKRPREASRLRVLPRLGHRARSYPEALAANLEREPRARERAHGSLHRHVEVEIHAAEAYRAKR
ncbi:MAG: hypothetical protein AB7P00_36095, partial [Sandaracinaceae bacterium]